MLLPLMLAVHKSDVMPWLKKEVPDRSLDSPTCARPVSDLYPPLLSRAPTPRAEHIGASTARDPRHGHT